MGVIEKSERRRLLFVFYVEYVIYMKLLLLFSLSVCLLQASAEDVMPKEMQARESVSSNVAGNWLRAELARIEGLKPGQSTRADLMELFTYQGGLSTREKATFVYLPCFFIKIDAEFEVVNKDDEGSDVIKSLSKPYLESVMIAD